MPSPVVPRSIQLPPEVDQEVMDFQASRGLSSFSKALQAMLAERKELLSQRQGDRNDS
jgi:hypothetical protein